jgi:hypothetical protein
MLNLIFQIHYSEAAPKPFTSLTSAATDSCKPSNSRPDERRQTLKFISASATPTNGNKKFERTKELLIQF